jgi:hypothetical protein
MAPLADLQPEAPQSIEQLACFERLGLKAHHQGLDRGQSSPQYRAIRPADATRSTDPGPIGTSGLRKGSPSPALEIYQMAGTARAGDTAHPPRLSTANRRLWPWTRSGVPHVRLYQSHSPKTRSKTAIAARSGSVKKVPPKSSFPTRPLPSLQHSPDRSARRDPVGAAAGCDAGAELGDAAGRRDAADLAGIEFRKPEVAVRTGGDRVRGTVGRKAGGELGDVSVRADPADLAGIELGEPEAIVPRYLPCASYCNPSSSSTSASNQKASGACSPEGVANKRSTAATSSVDGADCREV